MIKFQDISKHYDNKQVLNNMSFIIKDNETVGIAAPNGTGKSVVLETLIGKQLPDEGAVFIDNGLRSNIFYQAQRDNFPENMLVKELIEFYLIVNKKT